MYKPTYTCWNSKMPKAIASKRPKLSRNDFGNETGGITKSLGSTCSPIKRKGIL